MSLEDHLSAIEELDRDCTQCGYPTTFLIRGGKVNRWSLFCPGCNVGKGNPYLAHLRKFRVAEDGDDQ